MALCAITFDWWNTLFRDANSEERQQMRMDALIKATGATPAEAEQALRAVWVEFDRSHRQDKRTLLTRDAVRIAAEYLRIHIDPKEASRVAHAFATAVVHHAPEPVEHALDAVRAAAERLPLGIISDTGVSPGTSLRQVMDRYGFTNWFSAMTFSDELGGTAKPQASVFRRTARLLGVRARDTLHIGDLLHTDIAGAKGVHAKAGLFTGVSFIPNPDAPEPDYVFAKWADFISQLPALLDAHSE